MPRTIARSVPMKAESQASVRKFKIFATFVGHIHSLIPALKEINNTG